MGRSRSYRLAVQPVVMYRVVLREIRVRTARGLKSGHNSTHKDREERFILTGSFRQLSYTNS